MHETDTLNDLANIYDRILGLSQQAESGAYEPVMNALTGVAEMVESAIISDAQRALLRFMLSSAMINTAADACSMDGLSAGVQWAARLFDDGSTPPDIARQARLNQANGLVEIYALSENRDIGDGVVAADPEYRLTNTDDLRQIRAMLNSIGIDPLAPSDTRSRALCNLGNVLDESGRWVEAYAVYSDALEADPSNGNAAGNIAELLRRRLTRPTGQHGHLAAVYNHYARLAQSLEHRTVEIAGPAAAQRWNQLELSETEGHTSHDGDPLDPYQQWIVEHRLALVDVLEGLGSDSDRWDSSAVSAVVTSVDDTVVPRIFAAFNVLKSEYLVARRLAFTGITMIEESGFQQHPADTGLYSDTLDGGFYGEGPATLLLAQRSALDVLDKIAVTANEHFQSGVAPSRVDFVSYWIAPKTGDVRPTLVSGNPGRRSVLALAELAADTGTDGMYAESRLLRNAGTHRLVHVTAGTPTGPTKDTFSSVDIEDLLDATITALWVTRAAYMYLVDLLDSQAPSAGTFATARVPNQR